MRGRLSRAEFYRHPAQVLLALVGIAAGIAVVTGVALLRQALVESLDRVSDELVGRRAVIVRHASGRIAVEEFARLALLPGAPDLAPLLRAPVRADGTRLELVGLDPFAGQPPGGDAVAVDWPGALFAATDGAPNAVATRATLDLLGADPGDQVAIEIGGSTRFVRIAGALEARSGLDRRLFVDIVEAQALANARGTISELLAPAAARDWLEAHIDADMTLVSVSQQRASARGLTRGMRANLAAMSLLALASGLFVVYSVLSFLLVRRRRTFGLLRALGMTHRCLARMLICEVLLIAAAGGLAGLVAGTVLADRLLALLAAPVAELYGQLAPITVDPDALLYALIWCAGLVAASAVTVPVLREALRIPPGRLARSVAPIPGRTRRVLALAALLIAAGLVWARVDSGLVAALGGLFLVMAGMVVVVPRAGFALIAGFGHWRRGGLAGRAMKLLLGARARLSPALAALSLSLALAVGMGMMIFGFRDVVDHWVGRLLRADGYVSIDDRALREHERVRLAGLPGVRAVSSVRRVRLADGTRVTAYELERESFAGFELLQGDPDDAWRAFDAGRAVLVSEPLARRAGLQAGDSYRLLSPAGPVCLAVAGVFRDYSSEQGFVAIPRALYRDWYGDGRYDSVGIYLDPNTPPDEFARSLDGLGWARAGWVTPAEVRQQTLAVFDRTFRISWAMALLVGLIALLTLTSALLAQGLERAREHATLRALGLVPRSLFALVTVQSFGLTVVALLAALPLAALIHAGLVTLVHPRAFGWSVPLGLPPLEPALWVVPPALALGTAAGLYPAWRIGRRPIIEHLRAER